MDKKASASVAAVVVIALIAGGALWQQLAATSNELAATKAELTSTEGELQIAKIQAGTNAVNLDSLQRQLDTSKAELNGLKTQYDRDRVQWETQSSQTARQYSDLRDQIYFRLGDDKRVQEFITPNDPAVASTVKEAAGSYKEDVNQRWADFQRLYQWVVDNIKYSKDTRVPVLPSTMGGTVTWAKDFWRMPSETLEDETGDCEDMATLLASMLLNYNGGKYSVWVLRIESADPAVSGHVAVAFPVAGKKLSVVDPAGNYYTGRSSRYSLTAEDVATAVDSWLSYWAKEIPNGRVAAAFSPELYREFKTNQEFIDWAAGVG